MALPSYQLTLTENVQITPSVRKLQFKFSDPTVFSYVPGQFVSFNLTSFLPLEEQTNEDGKAKILKRSYSIANLETSPDNTGYLEIVIAYVENGRATKIFFEAEVGTTFDITGPVGMLTLDEATPQRVILCGTGTGVAPYRSMLNQLPAKKDTEFHIIFGAQFAKDLFYTEDFIAAAQHDNVHFHPCLSREDATQETELNQDNCVSAQFGYVQKALESLNPNPETDKVYLCGNPNMVDDVFTLLKDKEFPIKQVKREKYIFSKF